MKTRVIFLIKTYLFWLLFFVIQKPMFMIWQYGLLGEVRAIDWLLVPMHGLPLDMSVAAYITAVTGVMLCISCWVKWRIMRPVIDTINGIVLFVALWAMLGDNGCFPSWGYHLNKDIFSYLASPAEALACAPWWVWTLGTIGFVILFIAWGLLWRLTMHNTGCKMQSEQSANYEVAKGWKGVGQTFGLLLLTGFLFLPMRGSVTVSTMNTGRVYYSNNRMLNIAAVNPLFNIIESLSEDQFCSDRYYYMDEAAAEAITDSLYCRNLEPQVSDTFLTTMRPNIVLCILESFTMNAMRDGAMPQMERLSHEGVFCSQTYASSYRTDRGVMAILGGFPGLATTSLMTVPTKSGKLPQIGNVLEDAGYQLQFFYGGDEDFTNMRSYLITGGFRNRVADRDFPISDQLSKWGAPDHVLFKRVFDEIRGREDVAPTFDGILSLSSHEPFEVPYHHLADPYLNAIAYTDSCVGALVDSLRTLDTWNKTLVVLVADHGFSYPGHIQGENPEHHHIPMLFIGGAVSTVRTIDKPCQQVDWVTTVLNQMGLDSSPFVYSKDLLDNRIPAFAYYHFWDGCALITAQDTTIVDAASNQTLCGSQTRAAKAVTQTIIHTIDGL